MTLGEFINLDPSRDRIRNRFGAEYTVLEKRYGFGTRPELRLDGRRHGELIVREIQDWGVLKDHRNQADEWGMRFEAVKQNLDKLKRQSANNDVPAAKIAWDMGEKNGDDTVKVVYVIDVQARRSPYRNEPPTTADPVHTTGYISPSVLREMQRIQEMWGVQDTKRPQVTQFGHVDLLDFLVKSGDMAKEELKQMKDQKDEGMKPTPPQTPTVEGLAKACKFNANNALRTAGRIERLISGNDATVELLEPPVLAIQSEMDFTNEMLLHLNDCLTRIENLLANTEKAVPCKNE